jgi:hypothetical protein
MMMNIQRQPNVSISAVGTGAASPVPSVEEPLKMPVASPRWRTANQSRTTRPAEGNCGASPMPSSRRAAKIVVLRNGRLRGAFGGPACGLATHPLTGCAPFKRIRCGCASHPAGIARIAVAA